MFYKVKSNLEFCNFLRFLWWENEEFKGELIEFRIIVYFFGVILLIGWVNVIFKVIIDYYEL